MEEIQNNMMQSGFRFMWKFGRLEAEAKMRRVVQQTVRDGCDEVEKKVCCLLFSVFVQTKEKREKLTHVFNAI